MRRLPRHVLVPAVGFGVMLAAAIGVTAALGSRPEARIHARVTAYLRALHDDDAGTAATFHEDPATSGIERERALVFRGRTWWLEALAYDARSGLARVDVVWLDGGSRIHSREALAWRSDDRGAWWLVGLESRDGGRRLR